MSFGDFALSNDRRSHAARRAGGGGGADDGDPYGPLESSVFQLTTRVSGYKRMVDQMGSRKDTKDFRARLREVGEDIGVLAKKTSAAFRKTSPTPEAKQRHAKLLSDFQNVLGEFQRSQRLCAEKGAATMPKSTPVKKKRRARQGAPAAEDGVGLLDAGEDELARANEEARVQEQLRVDGELEYNNLLIEEREQDIKEIQQQIGEVNEIFQDLAVLVHDQSDLVDDIEANIVTSHDHTRTANKELKVAAKHQRATRTRLCILTIVLVVAIAVLVILMQN